MIYFEVDWITSAACHVRSVSKIGKDSALMHKIDS
jgi:hypothetical protein